MARIAGINLPGSKPIIVALTAIFGIGRKLSQQILRTAAIDPGKRANSLSDEEIARLKEIIEKDYTVEGELRMSIGQDIRRLKEIGSYRGSRHARKLPVRGQRTKTNARTKRGKRVTVGSGRKPAAEKT